ncbi:unnamed protein product (macronuclear) [Paramecium tetraurelia]|uniref:Uncharacterized protein n=1 Tax=Paramecium tetraurelia TaxID=5888 RepID=A0BWM7_PARTE|nr:uncharacterized protein GSPATT00032796001 [Paramecium tetraurelia]CAK62944.1 unnamed protein product [Paramecium tetraurelia]|eukprot:XP_001430342.1 hypothetical protein (macronuclear) [Paramecium tetraurelia strain d4-2]
MSTIEKAIQQLRKQYEYTHNSTEIHSNASFFEEERSEHYQDDDLSWQEDFPDYLQMSSCQLDSSLLPLQSSESSKKFSTNPTQTLVRGQGYFVQEIVDDVNEYINNNNSQTGKGIAIHVRGQGSIGISTKKGKKLEKYNKKKIQNLNNQININNNNALESQSQQQSSSNQPSPSQSNDQQNKQICQSQKVILAYLMVESDVSKQAQQRAENFIQKYMQNENNLENLQNIQEAYKIMLLPEQVIQQLAQALSQEERMLYLNLSLHRLNLQNNRHPFAAKAAAKITKQIKIC